MCLHGTSTDMFADAYQYDDGYQNQHISSQHHERGTGVLGEQWGGSDQNPLLSKSINMLLPRKSTGSGRRRKKRRSAD